MFRLFNNDKETTETSPLLTGSINGHVASEETTLAIPKYPRRRPKKQNNDELFITMVKMIFDNHSKYNLLRFFENPHDLIRLLKVNKATHALQLANLSLIESLFIPPKFRHEMLNELHKRERDPFDKLIAGMSSLNTGLQIVLMTADIALLSIAASTMGYYGIQFAKEKYPMSTTTVTDLGSSSFNTSTTTTITQEYLNYVDPALLPLVGTTLLTAALLVFTLTIMAAHLKKYNSLQERYNSRDNAAIKRLEDRIHDKIINTTDKDAKSERYQQWMKHYIWHEKVNRPVLPFDAEAAEGVEPVQAQNALGV